MPPAVQWPPLLSLSLLLATYLGGFLGSTVFLHLRDWPRTWLLPLGLGLRSLSLGSLSSPTLTPASRQVRPKTSPSQWVPGFCIHVAAFLPTPPPTPIPLASPGPQQSPAAKSDPRPRWQEWEVATGRGSVRWRAGQARGSLQDTPKLGRSGSNSGSRHV